MRKAHPSLSNLGKEDMEVSCTGGKILLVRRWNGKAQSAAAYNFGDAPASIDFPLPEGRWEKLIESSDERWCGGGGTVPYELEAEASASISLKPMSFVLLSMM